MLSSLITHKRFKGCILDTFRQFLCKRRTEQQSGMTLLELLVVVTILTTLALFAYPAYQQHMTSSHRVKAMSDLMLLRLQNEISDRSDETRTRVIVDGYCTARVPCQSDYRRFWFSISEHEEGYVIQAKAIGAQTEDRCPTLLLHSSGRTEPLNCWQ